MRFRSPFAYLNWYLVMESDPSLLKKYQPVVLCSVTIRRSSCDYFLLDADALIWFAVCVDVLMMSDPRSSSDSCGSVLLYQCSTEPNLGYKPLSRPNLFKCFLWKQWPLSLLGLDFSSFVFFFFGLIHYFPMVLFWYKSDDCFFFVLLLFERCLCVRAPHKQ